MKFQKKKINFAKLTDISVFDKWKEKSHDLMHDSSL